MQKKTEAENLIPVLERIIPRLLFERAEPTIAAMTRRAEAGCAEMQLNKITKRRRSRCENWKISETGACP